jgi:hypothetical protein
MQIELILLFFLIILGVLYAGNCGDNTGRKLLTILICILVIIIFCYMRLKNCSARGQAGWTAWGNYEGFLNYAPKSYELGKCGGIDYMGKADINPVYKNYDGLFLKSTPRPNVPLTSDVTIFTPVGDGVRLTEDPVSYTFNTVDGKATSPRHMFMLANNQVSWDCCPSTYSSDRGCVCVTKEQEEMINKRYGNRNTDGYPSM